MAKPIKVFIKTERGNVRACFYSKATGKNLVDFAVKHFNLDIEDNYSLFMLGGNAEKLGLPLDATIEEAHIKDNDCFIVSHS